MLGCSGLLRSAYGPYTRTIGAKVASARNRAAQRKIIENPVPIADDAAKQAAPKRIIELKYPLQTLPKSTLATGWLEPLGGTEHLPFQFTRTANKQLPVYSDVRNGRTRRITVLRKYTGDVRELKQELVRLLGEKTKIQEHAAFLEVDGHHVAKLKRWLRRLGF